MILQKERIIQIKKEIAELKAELRRYPTQEEVDALQCLWDGLTYQQAGKKLFRSSRTIHSRIDSVKKKTNIYNLVLLLRWAKKNEYIE